MASSDHRSTIEQYGWRQGSILPPELVRCLIANAEPSAAATRIPNNVGAAFSHLWRMLWRCILRTPDDSFPADIDREAWVVISQDCDVVNEDFQKEPFVEILRLKPAQKRDGNSEFGKSPRSYQCPLVTQQSEALMQCSIHERERVPHSYFVDVKPDQSRHLKDETIRELAHWMSQRYVRSSFPDAFNRRCGNAAKGIRKLSDINLLSEILIGIEDEDKEENDAYEIDVRLVMKTVDYKSAEKRSRADAVAMRIEELFEGCESVNATVRLQPEQEISLDDVRYLRRWDFDDISIRTHNADDLPPHL